MQVSESVRAVQVPETNPMHPQFTTIYLVGRGQVLTIDSGADEERYRWMLRGYLAATEKAEIAQCALTHYHADHSSNLRWICDEFEAEAVVSRATAERIPDRLPAAVRHLEDGHDLDLEQAPRLRVISTPGHSPDSVCFYLEDEGVLFTGDTVLGAATTAVQDLGAYLDSLRRLRDLPNLRLICPGHGPIIDEPIAYIDAYIRHREQRERDIVAQLAEGPPLTSWEIMERLYAQIDPRLRRLADANVRTHLAKLEQEGRLRVHPGRRRPRSPEDEARARAEEQEREAVLRKAEEYREQSRRRALFLHENPPTEEWLEPPRYEIVPG